MQAIVNLQPTLIRQFQSAIEHDQLSQAYVFSGQPGTGKAQLAQWLAMRLFCQNVQDNQPCGECAECQRILSGNHPDVVTLKTDARSIKVDDVRELKSELSKSGVEGQTRVFVIEQAEKMTPGAANSLLKFYEEPVAGAVIILTTAAKNQLLPTILSRAQIINFPNPPQSQIQAQLVESGATAKDAALAAHLTADLTAAQALIASDDFTARAQAVVAWANQLAQGDGMAFVNVQAQLLPHAKALPEQNQVLALLALIYEDALNQHFHVDTSPAFLGEPVVATLAGQASKTLSASLSAILAAQVRLRQNVNFQSATEAMVLAILALH